MQSWKWGTSIKLYYGYRGLLSWTACQELNYVEYFAGQANVWRAVSQEYPAARVDMDYSDPTYREKMNPMNFLSSPGYAILDPNEKNVNW